MFSPTTQYMTKMCVCTVWHVVEGLVGGAFAWEGHGGLLRGKTSGGSVHGVWG